MLLAQAFSPSAWPVRYGQSASAASSAPAKQGFAVILQRSSLFTTSEPDHPYQRNIWNQTLRSKCGLVASQPTVSCNSEITRADAERAGAP